jgi:hypothetical protein
MPEQGYAATCVHTCQRTLQSSKTHESRPDGVAPEWRIAISNARVHESLVRRGAASISATRAEVGAKEAGCCLVDMITRLAKVILAVLMLPWIAGESASPFFPSFS